MEEKDYSKLTREERDKEVQELKRKIRQIDVNVRKLRQERDKLAKELGI